MIWATDGAKQMHVLQFFAMPTQKSSSDLELFIFLHAQMQGAGLLISAQRTCVSMQQICRNRLFVMHTIRIAAVLLIFKHVIVLTEHSLTHPTYVIVLFWYTPPKLHQESCQRHAQMHMQHAILFSLRKCMHITQVCTVLLQNALLHPNCLAGLIQPNWG